MKTVQLTITIWLVLLLNSSAAALSPIGPATSEAKKGQVSLGLEYFTGEFDLTTTVLGINVPMELEPTGFFAKPSYSFADRSEFFARIGIARVDKESDDQFAWGLGGKATLARKDDLSCGILAQMDWNYDKEQGIMMFEGVPVMLDGDLELRNLLVAFGITLQKESLAIYGGPFIRFIDGDMDIRLNGIPLLADIENDSEFGGYIGASVGSESLSFNVEYQKTNGSWLVGTGLTFAF